MRFYSLVDAPTSLNDVVFRESRLWKLIASSTFFFLFLLPAIAGPRTLGWVSFSIGTFFLLLIILLPTRALLCTFKSQNWILRLQPDGILVNFRNYINTTLDPHDLVVVHVDAREIVSFSRTFEQIILPSTDNDFQRDSRWYLDIHLASTPENTSHLARLRLLLSEEANRTTPLGWGSPIVPVRLLDSATIRVSWSCPAVGITPGLRRAIQSLRQIAPESDERRVYKDFFAPTANQKENEQRMIDLAARGDTLGAVLLAMKYYGYTLTEAREFIKQLTKTASPLSSEPVQEPQSPDRSATDQAAMR